MSICTIDGCNRVSHRRGYCITHYFRWKRHGNPQELLRALNGAPMKWPHEHKDHIGDECLIWPFYRHPGGYAQLGNGAGSASRIMCGFAHGPAPSSLHQTAHSCGKGHLGCVNPRHLRWATAKENRADMIGHGSLPCGERHYRSKLTQEQVSEIRAKKDVSLSMFARKYGIAPSTISRIRNRKTWSSV